MGRAAQFTPEQWFALGELLQAAFVEIRFVAPTDGRRAADLADAVHEIPVEVHGWGGGWRPDWVRQLLQRYQDKYSGEDVECSPTNYVALLDAILAMGKGEDEKS